MDRAEVSRGKLEAASNLIGSLILAESSDSPSVAVLELFRSLTDCANVGSVIALPPNLSRRVYKLEVGGDERWARDFVG